MNALYSVTDKLSHLFFGRGGPDPGGGGGGFTEGRNQGNSLNNSFSHDMLYENTLGRDASFGARTLDSEFPAASAFGSQIRNTSRVGFFP